MSKVEQSSEYPEETLDWARNRKRRFHPTNSMHPSIGTGRSQERIVEVIAKAMERRPSRRT